MKQINILKKAAGAISILLLLLSLAACGNMLEERKGNTVVEPVENSGAGILVRGEIKVQGAVPSRAATSCFDGDFSWRITAQNLDITDNTDPNFLANSFTTTNRFTITLPCAGNWLISASGYAGTFTKETLPSSSEVFSGFDSFTITEEGSNRAIVIHPVVWGDSLFPTQGANPVKGSINLPITSNAENVYQVSAKLIKNNSTTTATEEVVTIPPKTFTTGSSSLEASDVPAGFYTAKIIFEDSIGNILYSCHEGISVYPGLTTDTWYGIAPYLNNGVFTLTSRLVEKYGAELVPNTQLVLYDYYSTNNTNSGYKYYLADSASSSLTTADLTNNEPYQNNFCFDKDGNLYALMNDSGSSELYLISTRSGFVSSDTGRAPGSELFITIDRDQDTLWLLADQELSLYGYKNFSEHNSLANYPTNLRSAYVSSNYFYDGSGNSYYPTAFTAANGHLYLAGTRNYSSNSGSVYKVIVTKTDVESDLEDDGYGNISLHCNDSKVIDIPDLGFSSSATVNDILYQDGSVYILVSEKNIDLHMDFSDPQHPEIMDTLIGNIFNRGVVIKYDTITGAVSYICSAKDSVSLEKLHVLGRMSGGPDYRLYLNTDKTPLMYNISEHSGSYADVYAYLSSDLTAKVLHSPQKFIAIKPKKLVIADDGVAYYIDSAKGLRYKNENRVVEIDLETFAISKVEPASVAFGEDESGDNVFSFTVNSVFSSETTYYGGDPIGELSGIGNFFPGILSEDD